MNYKAMNSLKLDSYQQIIRVLSKNEETVGKFTKFQSSFDRLKQNHKEITDLTSELKNDASTAEKAKENDRNSLIKATMPVVTILQIFAYDKKKKNLLQEVDNLSLEYLQNCTDRQLVKLSKRVWTLANKYAEYSLAFVSKIKSSLHADKLKAVGKLQRRYGLIPEMIKNMEESNIRFINSLLSYEDERKKKEKTIRKIKSDYNETEDLLKNKIDRFISLFEAREPEFFKEYRNVRMNLLQVQDEKKEKDFQNVLSADDISPKQPTSEPVNSLPQQEPVPQK